MQKKSTCTLIHNLLIFIRKAKSGIEPLLKNLQFHTLPLCYLAFLINRDNHLADTGFELYFWVMSPTN